MHNLRSADDWYIEFVQRLSSADAADRPATAKEITREIQRDAIEAAADQCRRFTHGNAYAIEVLQLLPYCAPAPSGTMTPGPWRRGNGFVYGNADGANPSDVSYYGGRLIAESIAPGNIGPISAVPDLIQACKIALAERPDLGCAPTLRLAIFKADPAYCDAAFPQLPKAQ